MEITKVRVNKVDNENSRVKGYVTVTIDDCFVIKNIRIIKTDEGWRVAMPNHKIGEKYEDYCHPINKETRTMFEEKIMEEYNNPTNVKE